MRLSVLSLLAILALGYPIVAKTMNVSDQIDEGNNDPSGREFLHASGPNHRPTVQNHLDPQPPVQNPLGYRPSVRNHADPHPPRQNHLTDCATYPPMDVQNGLMNTAGNYQTHPSYIHGAPAPQHNYNNDFGSLSPYQPYPNAYSTNPYPYMDPEYPAFDPRLALGPVSEGQNQVQHEQRFSGYFESNQPFPRAPYQSEPANSLPSIDTVLSPSSNGPQSSAHSTTFSCDSCTISTQAGPSTSSEPPKTEGTTRKRKLKLTKEQIEFVEEEIARPRRKHRPADKNATDEETRKKRNDALKKHLALKKIKEQEKDELYKKLLKNLHTALHDLEALRGVLQDLAEQIPEIRLILKRGNHERLLEPTEQETILARIHDMENPEEDENEDDGSGRKRKRTKRDEEA